MCLSSSNHVDSGALPQVKPWWTTSIELAELFSKLGLGKYTDLFQQQEVGFCCKQIKGTNSDAVLYVEDFLSSQTSSMCLAAKHQIICAKC